jgi:uncharacterized protein YqhQ
MADEKTSGLDIHGSGDACANAAHGSYGGQAIIEGVMIRGKTRVAAAVRQKDGSITLLREEADSKRPRWLSWPVLRGTPALIDSLRLGYRMLMWSADVTMEGEGQRKPNPFEYVFSMVVALVFAVGLFKVLPALLARWLPMMQHVRSPGTFWEQLAPSSARILPNLAEGGFSLLILVGYIVAIGFSKEVKRIFAYHGAEHKVVNAWEADEPLTLDTARRYSRIHPRCGTSFLFFLFFVGILVHALLGWPSNIWLLIGSRLVLIPVLAGLSYEIIRLAGRFRLAWWTAVLASPGLLLQRLTTAEPTDDQIEVAMAAMRAVLEDEGVLTPVVTETPSLT